MTRPCKLTPEIQQRIGENIALGLTYRLAAESAGVTYKTLNEWNQKGKTEKSGKYFDFISTFKSRMLMPQKYFWNVLMNPPKVGTVRFACGSLSEGFLKNLEGGYIGNSIQFRRIRMRVPLQKKYFCILHNKMRNLGFFL
jgi:hypothetical protein